MLPLLAPILDTEDERTSRALCDWFVAQLLSGCGFSLDNEVLTTFRGPAVTLMETRSLPLQPSSNDDVRRSRRPLIGRRPPRTCLAPPTSPSPAAQGTKVCQKL